MQRFTTPGATPSNGHSSPTVSVVIPTLNEERNLPHVFAKLPDGITEVIVVDGGSVDRTVAVARELRPDVVIVQQTRTGKGNALACGFAACTGDIIVMIDADGSTDPGEIPAFVDALIAGADFVKGSRFDKGGHSHDITALRKVGNDGLNIVVNVLFGTRFTDLCYGYNAFWRRVVPTLDLPDPACRRPRPGEGVGCGRTRTRRMAARLPAHHEPGRGHHHGDAVQCFHRQPEPARHHPVGQHRHHPARLQPVRGLHRRRPTHVPATARRLHPFGGAGSVGWSRDPA